MSTQPNRKRGKASGSGSGGSGKKKPRTDPAQSSLTRWEISRLGRKLYFACWNGKTAEAKRLISEGAPVDWQEGDGTAPLHEASRFGYTEIVMLLLKNKCNISVTDKNGNTPLILAAFGNRMDTVRALVEAGCDITIRDNEHKTAAEWANHCSGTGPVAEYLRSTRFFRSARDESGQLRRVKGPATRAIERDLEETGLLPSGPLSIIKEFATGER